ncbi:GAF and ANTAR domain-containing protein [Curtobacterium sp. MCSS17_007]|uniref:GAF and ANTAR domain-containing protein n=1 Tax=Curtobacterium sp. MCSS17_007 TaxID=2175646 RepID=UPI0015E88604|nr:GAF and ANTAR domain-containing protein [Curtobacterium sp. MCSS17_007]WIE74956.1 GAF and ANTAR domain-containing protein [Curtobacterium sp. MCSS17_007]
MEQDRERRLIDAFLVATSTLVGEYDVVEMLQTLVDEVVELFALDAVGITLANERQELEVVAGNGARARLLELLQLETGAGPCVEAWSTGTPRSADDLDEMTRSWPLFAEATASAGFVSVYSLPLRSRDTVLGSMNLFRSRPGPLDERDLAAIRALTDVASLSILQQRSADQAVRTQDQLQRALDSRVAIEQAKGFLAQTHEVDLDEAFALLRRWARSNNVLLQEAALGVTARRIVIPPRASEEGVRPSVR